MDGKVADDSTRLVGGPLAQGERPSTYSLIKRPHAQVERASLYGLPSLRGFTKVPLMQGERPSLYGVVKGVARKASGRAHAAW